MAHKVVGERIKSLRESNNFTRDAFAEKIGISSKFLYEIEMGKKGFSAETLVKISQAVSVSCDYIMTGSLQDDRFVNNVVCELEGFEPGQIGQVRDILKMIRKLCVTK